MNDYWNDPPEQPDLPVCCEDFMDILEDGNAVCGKCGKRIETRQEEYELPEPDDTLEERDSEKEKFPEDTYDYAADDLAFDAERERRLKF